MIQRKFSVVIIGGGRIAQALHYFFSQAGFAAKVSYLAGDSDARACDLLVGALPGDLGDKCLRLALKCQKSLLDISDMDPEFYQGKIKEIGQSGITVVPGCGFCPGLVNFILGRETARTEGIKEIEVMAGSLSRQRFYYPFLWCFEDLVLEHRIPSWQIISGKKKKFPPFAGYRREKLYGVEAESYYSASGFENILEKTKVRDLKCRLVRPLGFEVFFNFLERQGFLSKDNLPLTKKIAESKLDENYSLAEIKIKSRRKNILWRLKSFSRKGEKLNSMQKITASVPVALAKLIAGGTVLPKGLVFMEDLGAEERVFIPLLKGITGQVQVTRRQNQS